MPGTKTICTTLTFGLMLASNATALGVGPVPKVPSQYPTKGAFEKPAKPETVSKGRVGSGATKAPLAEGPDR